VFDLFLKAFFHPLFGVYGGVISSPVGGFRLFGCLSSLASHFICLPVWLVLPIHLWTSVSQFMCRPVWLVVSGSLDVGDHVSLDFKSVNDKNKPVVLGLLGAMLSLCWAKNGVFFLSLVLRPKGTRRFWVMSGPCWAYVGFMLVRTCRLSEPSFSLYFCFHFANSGTK